MGIERLHAFARKCLLTPFGLCVFASLIGHGLILTLPGWAPQAPVQAAGPLQLHLPARLSAVQASLRPASALPASVVPAKPSRVPPVPPSRLPEPPPVSAPAERLPAMAAPAKSPLARRAEAQSRVSAAAPPAPAPALASAAPAEPPSPALMHGNPAAHAPVPSPLAAPSVSPAIPPAPRDLADPLAEYRGQLAALLNRPRDYPPVAAMRGWEGEVRLRVRIARKGNLLAVSLERSSGFGVLDQHALAALERQGDFPPLPERWEGNEMQLVVPIHYRLRKTI